MLGIENLDWLAQQIKSAELHTATTWRFLAKKLTN